jgi:hypothetical protein
MIPLGKRIAWLRWTLRYWVLDKYREQLRGYAFFAAVCLFVGTAGHIYLDLRDVAEGRVVVAWVNWVVQIVLLVVSALLSYALSPKPEEPKPTTAKAPEVQDGKSIRKLYGTCWCEDPMVLGWKAMGTEKIKSSGGKK